MDMYQHDSAGMFRFVLRGELCGYRVEQLRHAWTTAQSILGTKELVVDISGIGATDAAGLELLSRMRGSGARLIAPLPPASPELVLSMGIPVAAAVHTRVDPLRACWHNLKRLWISARWRTPAPAPRSSN
ncbi:MAG TPA: hypothetical protein VMT86_20360 [Bryobacteraceae bacterium]|nr:hypothetical protein [Bryobacteraceae bacterium]